jgi:hypothetical protein
MLDSKVRHLHTSEDNATQARGISQTADVAKQRANETENQAAETNFLEYHIALNMWRRPL